MKDIKLYENIKEAMISVVEAEEAANGWKAEAKERMKDVNILIAAAKKVNKDTEIDTKALLAAIREDIAAEYEEAEDEETEDDEATEEEAE